MKKREDKKEEKGLRIDENVRVEEEKGLRIEGEKGKIKKRRKGLELKMKRK